MNNIILNAIIKNFNIYKIDTDLKIELNILDSNNIMHTIIRNFNTINYIDNLLYILDTNSIKNIDDNFIRIELNKENKITEIGNIIKERWILINE